MVADMRKSTVVECTNLHIKQIILKSLNQDLNLEQW